MKKAGQKPAQIAMKDNGLDPKQKGAERGPIKLVRRAPEPCGGGGGKGDAGKGSPPKNNVVPHSKEKTRNIEEPTKDSRTRWPGGGGGGGKFPEKVSKKQVVKGIWVDNSVQKKKILQREKRKIGKWKHMWRVQRTAGETMDQGWKGCHFKSKRVILESKGI